VEGKSRMTASTPSNAEILEQAHLEAIRGGIIIPTNTKQCTSSELMHYTDMMAREKMTRGGMTTSTASCGELRSIAEELIRGGYNTHSQSEPKTSSVSEQEGIYTLNARTAMIMGVYEMDWGKKKAGNIPSNHDRSQFSQEKYKFFLDAPFEISNMCCNVMKKAPIHDYTRRTGRLYLTAQMADESRLRQQQWLRNGCNGFEMKNPISNPMSFWTENDVLEYIARTGIEICSVYGDIVEDYDKQIDGQMCLADYGFGEKKCKYKCTGCKRTGCMLCGFGAHLEKPGEGRFEKLKDTHQKMLSLLDTCKNNGVTFREAIEWTNEHGNLNIRL
jgi:3'-phosphoadenosine 5'-phosphosulfate sulfotransferase (PAPS reductase)/FAD synthetase